MKMKRLIYLTISLFAAFSFASCNDDTSDEAWKDANLEAYNAITTNPEYKDVRSVFHPEDGTGPFGVYFKELKKGDGTKHPLQTSIVKILYEGRYYDSTYFNTGTKNNGIPVQITVNESYMLNYFMTRGLSFAIQNMVVGDRWEIWVPYYLGFGAYDLTDSTTGLVIIKAYSTLVYEIELVSIITYP